MNSTVARLIGIIILPTLFVGCAQRPPQVQASAPTDTSPSSSVIKPGWTQSLAVEETGTHLYFVSMAAPQTMGGIEGQRRAALLMAQQQLAAYLSSQVQAETYVRQSDGGKIELQQYTAVQSRMAQSATTMNVEKEWLDPETGMLYLRLEVAKN